MNIFIVCIGNICRSFMVEVILRKVIKEFGRSIEEYFILLVGIFIVNGMGVFENFIEVLKEIGIDLLNYRSKVIIKKLIDELDIILIMIKFYKEILV